MIAAVLKKCIFFLLGQTGRWRARSHATRSRLPKPPSSQAGNVNSTLCSGTVSLIC